MFTPTLICSSFPALRSPQGSWVPPPSPPVLPLCSPPVGTVLSRWRKLPVGAGRQVGGPELLLDSPGNEAGGAEAAGEGGGLGGRQRPQKGGLYIFPSFCENGAGLTPSPSTWGVGAGTAGIQRGV